MGRATSTFVPASVVVVIVVVVVVVVVKVLGGRTALEAVESRGQAD
jgi:heme exporter protein D